ncbi:hypothetical protein ONZ43_g5113 [Nemania bipapillata]|uniref:Uncharacterized protein n=1 Tax=Nemania bipapillata TaxID=110536 RepID=A0ACC2IER8_9PEZI|nr:hypothetical protein ONZ43_g5113 [Nemania bipapillata]
MQFSLTTVLPAVLAAFIPLTQALPANLLSRATIQQIADAQNQWRSDTSDVSQFLSAVPSFLGAGSKLSSAAQPALASEKDELLHKKVLDDAFGSDPRIINANEVLVNQGTFQFVVDSLQNYAENGSTMSDDDVTTLLQQVNSVRCGKVLPAIDMYFVVAGEKLNNGGTLVATRPNNC